MKVQESNFYEALVDSMPFAIYAIDIEKYEVVYMNTASREKLYAPDESLCFKKIYGQEDICSWCTISNFKQREDLEDSTKSESSFFDEVKDSWLQVYDEIVEWSDGRLVKYSIAVDISEQKEIQASFIKTHTKLALQTKKLKNAYKEMEILATKDFLTGANNRGNFFALAKNLIESNIDSDEGIYVAMLDIDKFKNINDTYGHKTGDIALQEFVKKIEMHLVEVDVFGRMGGEEFALITAATNNIEVETRVENIRKSISTITINSENNESIKFTVSIGVAKIESNMSLDGALELADKRLYEAKESGRDRVVFRSRT